MLNDEIVLDCLDYLISKETKKNEHQFEVESDYSFVKSSFLNTTNDFFKNTLINNIYSNIKQEKILVNDIIENKFLSNFINAYQDFNLYFNTSFADNLSHIKSNLSKIIDVDNVKNIEELISYCIIESFNEYSNTIIRFIEKNNKNDDAEFSTQYFSDFYKAKNDITIFNTLTDKPYGFYFFKTPLRIKSISNNEYSEFTIVSNQANGITLFNMNYRILNYIGISTKRYNTVNAFNKEHNILINNIDSEKSTYLSSNLKNTSDFDTELSLINKLIIIGLLSLFSDEDNRKSQENKKALISFDKDLNDKSLLPVVSSFKHNYDLPFITFDELRFKGDYAFLSFLDDLYQDILNIDVVNYKNDNLYSFYDILTNNVETESDFGSFYKEFTPKEFSFNDFNNFKIKEISREDVYVGINNYHFKIIPINNTIIGSNEDIYQNCFDSAKINKMSLYLYYNKFYSYLYKKEFETEMNDFISNHIEDLVTDTVFLSYINRIGSSNNIKSVYYHHTENVISHYDSELSPTMRIFNKDKKATMLLSISIDNKNLVDHLINEYDLSLSSNSHFFLKLFYANIQLNKLYEDTKSNKRRNINEILDTKIDLELNKWISFSTLFTFTIPLNKRILDNIYSNVNADFLNLKNVYI